MNDQNEDEIGLMDLLDFLSESRSLIVATVLISLGLGGVGFTLLPSRYDATGTIQMASVAGQTVESPQVLMEKIKLPLYFSQQTWEKCDTDEELTPSRKVSEKIHPVLNKSAPFISFTIGGSSVHEAKECLTAVINDIRVKQDQLSEPILLQKRVHLKTLEDKLEQAENAVKLFSGIQSNLNFKDDKFSASSLVLATKMASEGSVKDLTNQIEDMKISLLPPLSQSTNLASAIYCPDQPANKKLFLTICAALLAGFFLGVVAALLKKVYVNERARKLAAASVG